MCMLWLCECDVVPRRRRRRKRVEGGMENVKSSVVWLHQIWFLTIDGPMFVLSHHYQPHHPCLLAPSLYPSPPPEQLYQHDKRWRFTSSVTSAVLSLLPSPQLYFLVQVLGSTIVFAPPQTYLSTVMTFIHAAG